MLIAFDFFDKCIAIIKMTAKLIDMIVYRVYTKVFPKSTYSGHREISLIKISNNFIKESISQLNIIDHLSHSKQLNKIIIIHCNLGNAFLNNFLTYMLK